MTGTDDNMDENRPGEALQAALDRLNAAVDSVHKASATTRAGEAEADRAGLYVRIEELEEDIRALKAERDQLKALLGEAVDDLSLSIQAVEELTTAMQPQAGE